MLVANQKKRTKHTVPKSYSSCCFFYFQLNDLLTELSLALGLSKLTKKSSVVLLVSSVSVAALYPLVVWSRF